MANRRTCLTPEHATMRHEIALALEAARGGVPVQEWVGRLKPYLGWVPSAAQWRQYEKENVDPPGYIVVAAARAADVPLARLFHEPQTELAEAVRVLWEEIETIRWAAGIAGRYQTGRRPMVADRVDESADL